VSVETMRNVAQMFVELHLPCNRKITFKVIENGMNQ